MSTELRLSYEEPRMVSKNAMVSCPRCSAPSLLEMTYFKHRKGRVTEARFSSWCGHEAMVPDVLTYTMSCANGHSMMDTYHTNDIDRKEPELTMQHFIASQGIVVPNFPHLSFWD